MAEKPCACSPGYHCHSVRLGSVDMAMASGRLHGSSEMAKAIVTGFACGDMAKENDSGRGNYHGHHLVQRTLCRVSGSSPSEAELE